MCRPVKEESKNMSEAKPKIEWAKKSRRPARAAGPTKKEFVTKILGLESHTFDIGNAKYAAKYKKMVNAIANHIQREYKGRADIAKAIKELSLPTLRNPAYQTAKAGATIVNPGEIFFWQQDVTAVYQSSNLRTARSTRMCLSLGSAHPTLTASSKDLLHLCRPRPVIGRLYSVQYKSIFDVPDKVRRNTCEEARPSRLNLQLNLQRYEVDLDTKISTSSPLHSPS